MSIETHFQPVEEIIIILPTALNMLPFFFFEKIIFKKLSKQKVLTGLILMKTRKKAYPFNEMESFLFAGRKIQAKLIPVKGKDNKNRATTVCGHHFHL